jgi:glutaredoxin
VSGAAPVAPVVTLYGRRGCHLCEEARLLLERLAPRIGFRVQEVDVDSNLDLLARYDVLVPVVAIGEIEIARAPISAVTLERRLAAAMRG